MYSRFFTTKYLKRHLPFYLAIDIEDTGVAHLHSAECRLAYIGISKAKVVIRISKEFLYAMECNIQ